MQIRRVGLKNFRQFYGTQELEFPIKGNRNVTLIHAENGFGKTSILNAVLWCLFRDVTPKFERPDDIVNYEAEKAGETTASVDVEFEVGETQYLVTRVYDAGRDGRDKTQFSACKRDRSGVRPPLPAPETFINSVVPREMAKYFFFDGEAAESFAAAGNYREIGAAIRSILGCSLADTAIGDLKDLLKAVDRDIGDAAGDERIKELEAALAKTTTDLETAARLREQLIQALATLKEQHEDIVRGLREAEAAHEIQRNRDDKLEQKSRVATAIGECRAEILRWIGQRAVQVVSRRLSQVVFDFVDEAGLKGRIPSPYNEEFVRELLGSGVCVCNRPLNAGSAEWAAVANLLKSASNAELLGKVVRARARSQMLRDDGGNAPKLLHATQTKLAQLLTDQAHLEQQIAELGKRIESLDIKEIADRERARRAIEARLDKEQQELGGVRAHIATLEREKQQQEAQLEELLRKNKKTIKLLKKRQLVAKAIEILKRQLEGYEQDARARIQTDINDILESVAHKDFRCRFNDNFSIELILNERATAKSAGENQLLSLAFIASLVQFAAQRIDATDLILKPGTIAPLVLDAPLGQLDPRYQASVAEFLPKLARQVVLLVSGSQGGENVLKSLEPYVAAEYLLVQENREPRGKKQILRRTIRGKLRDLILFGQDRTMTRIDRLV